MTRRGLRLAAWPDADRIAWAAAIAAGDVFHRGPAAHWADTTRNAVIAAYGRWLGFLAERHASALVEEPVPRLTRDRLAEYLDHLAQTAGSVGRWAYFAHLRDAIRVMFPRKVPQILSRLVSRLERESCPRSKAERVVATPRLTALSKKLMKQAGGLKAKITDKIAYRDGLLVGVLALRPFRRRTFALITTRTHLCRVGSEWRFIFQDSETKSERGFETSLPQWITPLLERYLREVRPMFLGANTHDGLWVSTKGGLLTGDAIYRIVTKRTRDAFGTSVHPHLFRACAATTIAIEAPARIGIAADLLTHASLSTTKKFYCKASSIEASRMYASIIAGLRAGARRKFTRARRVSACPDTGFLSYQTQLS
jgi:integrase